MLNEVRGGDAVVDDPRHLRAVRSGRHTRTQRERDTLVNEARGEAEALTRKAEIAAQDARLAAEKEADKEQKARRAELDKVEQRLNRREEKLDERASALDERKDAVVEEEKNLQRLSQSFS